VKILDFGLARRSRGEPSLTATGLVVGTPHYMSPEQASGLELDTRADLFSLGCVLYTILAGELPFKGDSAMAVMMALATKTPHPLTEQNPAVPVSVSNLVARLMAKDRSERPRSAAEVVEMLDAVLAGLPPRIPTPPTGLTPAPLAGVEPAAPAGVHTPLGGTTAALRPRLPPTEPTLPGWWQVLRAAVVIAVVAAVILAWRLFRPPPPDKLGAVPLPRGPDVGRVYWGSCPSTQLRDWAHS
jgi:urea transport system substrate-binding protein